MRLQYGGNPHTRSSSWKRTSQNGTGENKSSEKMENTNKSQGCQEFPRIRQLLPTIYLQLQSYSETTKQTERQEGIEMGRRTSKGI